MVECMQRFPSNLVVQGDGCCALGNLAHENDDNRLAIAAAEGIEVLTRAMRMHANDTGVQVRGGH